MRMKSRYFLTIACLTAFSAFSESPLRYEQTSKKASDQKQSPSSWDFTRLPQWEITPTAAPRTRCGYNMFSTADFLWWKPRIDSTTYVLSGISDGGPFSPPGQSVSKGNSRSLNFEFEPGFRIGIGKTFPTDRWDLSLNYTWLANDTRHNSLTAGPGAGMISMLNVTFNNGSVGLMNLSEASSTWKQNFNMIDLDLGRAFFISSHLILRPHVGLKTAWIQNRAKFHYIPSPSITLAANTLLEADVKRNQHMWGLGLRAGMDTGWQFYRCWGLYGNLSLSGIWTDYHVHLIDWTFVTGLGGTTNLHSQLSIQNITPVLEIALGMSYTNWYANERIQFMAQAGWEQQVWFDFNHFTTLGSTIGGPSNLTFQGLTARFGLAY
jgi:hypothetical protein